MRISSFLILFMITSTLRAVETFEVVATPLFSEKNSGGNVETLTRQEMEATQEPFAQNQLERLPALNMTSLGTNGRTVDYTLRGAKASQNAVFLDGVPLNNPAAGGKFDFADFLVDDLEEIEVLPGANSVIYGADALGGVINMKTKKGRGKPRGLAKGEGGNFKTRHGHIEAQGEFHNLNFYAGGTGYTSGQGTFNNKVHHTHQSDKYRNATVSSSVGMTPNEDTEIWAFVRQMDANVRFDDLQFSPQENALLPVAADDFTHTRTVVGGLHGDLNTLEDMWEHHVVLGNTRTRRDTLFSEATTTSQGTESRAKYFQDLHWESWTTSTLGGDLSREKAEDTFSGIHTREGQAVFFQEKVIPLSGAELTGGVRYDHYSFGGRHVSYRLGASQKIHQSRLRTSMGTGFKPPILSDIFNADAFSVPNPNLNAETNQSFDIGVDHKIPEVVDLSLTGFYNRIEDVVISQSVLGGSKFQRVNGGTRVAHGFESALAYHPLASVKLRATATLTRAYDQHLKKRAPGIPPLKGTAEMYWTPVKDLELFATSLVKGRQTDAIISRSLKPYATVNMGAKYTIYDHVAFFGRIDNVGNRQYEDVFGYGVRGRFFLIGLEVKT